MCPVIDLGILRLPSYSVWVLLGAIAFTVVTIILIEKVEKAEPAITNRILILSVFGFAVLGGAAFLMNSLFHSIEKQKLVFGGITWLGGVIWAFPFMILMIHKFCPRVKGEALRFFNLLVPGIALAHGFGRIGCFMAGCCYGKRTDGIFGVSFPAGSTAANQYPAPDGGSLPVLPTQLFEAIFELLLFVVMMLTYKKLKRHFLEVYAFSYGAFRFLLELARGDSRGATGLGLTPSQIMSIVLMLMGLAALLYGRGIIFKKTRERMAELKEARLCSNEGAEVERITNTLRELKALADEGVITADEFEEKKKELLNRL